MLPIAGLKDSTGDPDPHARAARRVRRARLQRLGGDGAVRGALGCTGAILAAANLEPELSAKAFAGDVDSQRSLLDAHRIASFDSPHGLKRELHARYGTPPHCRHHHS